MHLHCSHPPLRAPLLVCIYFWIFWVNVNGDSTADKQGGLEGNTSRGLERPRVRCRGFGDHTSSEVCRPAPLGKKRDRERGVHTRRRVSKSLLFFSDDGMYRDQPKPSDLSLHLTWRSRGVSRPFRLHGFSFHPRGVVLPQSPRLPQNDNKRATEAARSAKTRRFR